MPARRAADDPEAGYSLFRKIPMPRTSVTIESPRARRISDASCGALYTTNTTTAVMTQKTGRVTISFIVPAGGVDVAAGYFSSMPSLGHLSTIVESLQKIVHCAFRHTCRWFIRGRGTRSGSVRSGLGAATPTRRCRERDVTRNEAVLTPRERPPRTPRKASPGERPLEPPGERQWLAAAFAHPDARKRISSSHAACGGSPSSWNGFSPAAVLGAIEADVGPDLARGIPVWDATRHHRGVHCSRSCHGELLIS